MGYSITYEHGQAVFLLSDEDRRRVVEWRTVDQYPVEIIHNASPRSQAEEPVCCSHIPGVCFPISSALPPALAGMYRKAGGTFDAATHEQVHAAMWVRWAIG